MAHSTTNDMTLIEQLKRDINLALGRSGENIVNMVEVYGGEFTAAEIDKHSLAAPAILIACLGWESMLGVPKKRIATPARDVKFAFFVLTKSPIREKRMMQALAIAERLSGFLIDWRSSGELSTGCVGVFDAPRAENLYGRSADAGGTALWLVTANIEVSYCASSVKPFMANLIAPKVTMESQVMADYQASLADPSAQSASISNDMI